MVNYYDLTYDQILSIHHEVEVQFPNIHKGVQQPGLLKSIVERPSQKHYSEEHFPDIYSKCASLIEAIIQWHPFYDGNKRTGLLAASYYMYRNKFMLVIPVWAVRFSVLVADRKKNFQEIKQWVQTLTAHSADEYFAKFKQYSDEPVVKVLSLLEHGKTDPDTTATKRANTIINNWLAIDIYPEYRMQDVETIKFLREQLITKFNEFPFR